MQRGKCCVFFSGIRFPSDQRRGGPSATNIEFMWSSAPSCTRRTAGIESMK
jgi:hypothetical protein